MKNHIIEAIYKKVKNNSATEFEKNALSKYYNVIHIKDSDYTEYKNQKQKFLLELDNENVKATGKNKLINKFKNFYYEKLDFLYKNLIWNQIFIISIKTDYLAVVDKNQYKNRIKTYWLKQILVVKWN